MFYKCAVLTEITLPASLTAISASSFSGCTSLKKVILPNGIVSIGNDAFRDCTSLTSATLPDNLVTIGENAFHHCTSLTSITVPDSVVTIGSGAFNGCTSLVGAILPSGLTEISNILFYGCTSLTGVIIPAGVTSIGTQSFHFCSSLKSVTLPAGLTTMEYSAFRDCTSLTSITIPSSLTVIGGYAFADSTALKDVYYSGSQTQWNGINISDGNGYLVRSTFHYNSTGPASEYIYDEKDPGASVVLPIERLDSVSDANSAANAVQSLTNAMTGEQKQSATGTDLATLFAENAVAAVASKSVSGNEIVVSAASVADLQSVPAQTSRAVENTLANGGISTARDISNTVTFTANSSNITVKVEPSILTASVDKVRVETPTYALTLDIPGMKSDLAQTLTLTAQDTGATGYSALLAAEGVSNLGPASVFAAATPNVSLTMPGGKVSSPITISLPAGSGSTAYQSVVDGTGAATSSKYNPATGKIDGKVTASGSYTVRSNEKDFTDISTKSAEMQNAIRYLASKGIINGTSDTKFSPDGSISRAEIAALMVRALGWTDNSAKPTFKDVATKNWYYSVVGVSQKRGLINGFTDNTFRGGSTISKVQILAIASRVLTSEMGYRAPANPAPYLTGYKDGVTGWAQPEIALATRENLVVKRTDGTFKGSGNMTRGDAAIIIYRLFQRIW